MPRVDSKGSAVTVGDRVIIRGTITAIAVGADNPNLTVAVDPTHVGQASSSTLTVQAREVQKD